MSYPHYSVDCKEVRAESGAPLIVCLCGSTRFIDEFRRQNLRLTLEGIIVLSIGCDTKTDAELGIVAGDLAPKKAMLDELHKRKIDLADRVFVLNVGGYIGDSTRSEIDYAQKIGVPVEYLEPGGAAAERAEHQWTYVPVPGSHYVWPPPEVADAMTDEST